ncbi:MAG: hypothetical protein ABIZ18_05240, partial [Caldimonas sp.]
MDRRLSDPAGAAHPSRVRRRLAWLGVVVAVLLLHGAVTLELAARMSEFDLANAMPQRVAVSYVRTIEPAVPPTVVVKVVPPVAKRAKRAPKRAAPAASAPEVVAVEPAASAAEEDTAAAAQSGVETAQAPAASAPE